MTAGHFVALEIRPVIPGWLVTNSAHAGGFPRFSAKCGCTARLRPGMGRMQKHGGCGCSPGTNNNGKGRKQPACGK